MSTCHRCGGHHDAGECLVQDLVCEIETHLRLHGPQSEIELQRHLEHALGAPRDAAMTAVARWCADNDA